MSILIENTNLREIQKSFFARAKYIILACIRRFNFKYLILTPSIFKSQLILDLKSKKLIYAKIRNQIDFSTLSEIFGEKDDYGLEKFKRYGEILDLYHSIQKRSLSPLIIDCGGNIGLASAFFYLNYPSSKVVCIEPDFNNIEQAKLNNFSHNVDFIEAAIGSESGAGNVIDIGVGNNAYRMEKSSSGLTKIITIDDVLSMYPTKDFYPFILKIDIEGFECELFSKNTSWIDCFPVIIIELHDWMLPGQAISHSFLKAIAPLKRDLLYRGENIFCIRNPLVTQTEDNA